MSKIKNIMDNVKKYFKNRVGFKSNKNTIYASPLKRIASFAVDLIVIMVIFNLFLNIAVHYGFNGDMYKHEIVIENEGSDEERVSVEERVDKKISMKINFMLLGISALYFTLFLSSKKQATIGNQLFKIMVVHTKNAKVGILTAFIRYVALLLNNTIYGLGYLLYFFRDDHAVLQDILSDTRVINVIE